MLSPPLIHIASVQIMISRILEYRSTMIMIAIYNNDKENEKIMFFTFLGKECVV